MYYREINMDLFSLPDNYILTHCVSADFALGAGIAVKFRDMGVKDELKRCCPDEVNTWEKGRCVFTLTNNIVTANLITKRLCWHKPTYQSLGDALYDMKRGLDTGIFRSNQIAMPLIGCGLDGLDWNIVRGIVQDMFQHDDLEILVCRYERQRAQNNFQRYNR